MSYFLGRQFYRSTQSILQTKKLNHLLFDCLILTPIEYKESYDKSGYYI